MTMKTLICSGLVCVLWTAAAAACAAQSAAVAFDGNRAYEHLRQVVGIGPRTPGTPAAQATRDYIRQQLAKAGITATEQAFDVDTPIGRLHMVNVIARIPGTSPDRIVVAGHYDTKIFREFRFVGANDAGSSTAFLIEWARLMKTRKNPYTMEALFLDGEESTHPTDWDDPNNRYGSRHYVETAQKDKALAGIKALILVDMIGDRDLQIERELYSTSWLTDAIWAAAKRLKHDDVFLGTGGSIEDDHIPFLRAGVPAVDIIDGPGSYPPWHTAGDTLDKVSARSLQIVGDVLLEALPAIEKRVAARPAGRGGAGF
jgi:glutaminyl-peptide cyclotransferase